MYTREEMVVLSLMYSKVRKDGYIVSVFNHLLLSEVFKASLVENLSLFDRNNIRELVEIAVEKCSLRHPDKKFDNCAKELRGFLSAFNYRKAIREAKSELRTAKEHKIHLVTYLEDGYPEHLKNLEVPPFVLYYKGVLPSESTFEKSLAIVGARNLEKNYGTELAYNIGEFLLDNGWYNVGCLAPGCAEYGHRGSIGATGVVLGQGLATTILPVKNNELAQEILDNGGFIMSELPPTKRINPVAVIARDRLQSGLTKGIIVVESSIGSGTMYAVRYALNQHKKIFVVDAEKFADEVRDSRDIKGNVELLNREKDLRTNVNISMEEKEKIIGVAQKEELKRYLDNIEEETRLEKEMELEKEIA
ncbi:hypothetical protein IX317_001826 [Fusobacterium sp. DD29]|uniref:DNA-processing protein DprA n=1 Tax=unclassified Fusobacterium TaxID=2648384 RepID=UPI001B8BB554|nr:MULTISPECIES: DNA-processing protein DprA [unclassified Fusobacterium]MBR8701504.1 hypothetical protein [Fusobacterium sp. DD45]MBR8711717.1 hypothetical protein [Fusobacterium sp. DD28]MBR8750142.1 hypothetical protein [Fusobacterium sp. DD29]MBR8752294.1 hypothetical protein [Fusobacterium sp. DD26]MBR8762384.1 hypothetical protein [Fusobacterium sp. DD25]